MRVSYSKLSTYFRCGFQYRLRYVGRSRGHDGDALNDAASLDRTS